MTPSGPRRLYATIATKEHYALDIIVGVMLGVAADALAWSRVVRIKADSSGRMSHCG